MARRAVLLATKISGQVSAGAVWLGAVDFFDSNHSRIKASECAAFARIKALFQCVCHELCPTIKEADCRRGQLAVGHVPLRLEHVPLRLEHAPLRLELGTALAGRIG